MNREFQELQVAATRDEQLRFVLRVALTERERRATGTGNAVAFQKTYEYASPFGAMAIWLDDTSDYLDTSLTSACQQIASRIVADLAVS